MTQVNAYVWVAGKNHLSDENEEHLKEYYDVDTLEEAMERAAVDVKKHLRKSVFDEMDELVLLEADYEVVEE